MTFEDARLRMTSVSRRLACSLVLVAWVGCGGGSSQRASSQPSQEDGGQPRQGNGGSIASGADAAIVNQDASVVTNDAGADAQNFSTMDSSAVSTGSILDAAGFPADANDAGIGMQDGAAMTSPVDDSQTVVPDPSWTCGMPAGIPPVKGGQLVLEADLTLGEVYDIGQTQYGQRTLIEIKGGKVSGPKISGQLNDLGLDWQLTLANGAIEDEEVDVLTTDDGTNIYFRMCGTSPGPAGSVRIVPDFEAPTGSAYDWLNSGVFAGTREFDPVAKTLKLTVYDVSSVAPGTSTVTIADPPGVPDQTWDCKTASGTETSVVYTETVGIANGTISIGASKRGTRSAIPITGGTTSGRITGSVLVGGADFPLMASSFVIDARYTLKTMEGDLIIVRNCGPLGSLVPVFETQTDGGYAWVNDNRWLSSDPSVGAGVVNLTIYDTQ